MTLTKAGVVQQVYEKHENLSKSQATEAVESFLRLSKDTLINGSDLLISGFGKVNVRDKNPRRGRNPQTGETLDLDARRIVTFRPSGMRSKVNAGCFYDQSLTRDLSKHFDFLYGPSCRTIVMMSQCLVMGNNIR
jgi:integration host factor subunit alpha